MNIKIVMTGKTTDRFVIEGINTYLNRLKHYSKVDWVELPAKKNNSDAAKVLADEAAMNLKLISKTDFVILLDETGKEFSSSLFAGWLDKHFTHHSRDLIFIIGGAYGFHSSLYDRADFKMALSKMTFTHQMVRLIFAEQLYRAFTIIRNEKYHH
ncbi:MAG: 23S rRNA (pseudouridine(1915)-N(3))-methyltransferase RlmH [Bacteroidia bacterium]